MDDIVKMSGESSTTAYFLKILTMLCEHDGQDRRSYLQLLEKTTGLGGLSRKSLQRIYDNLTQSAVCKNGNITIIFRSLVALHPSEDGFVFLVDNVEYGNWYDIGIGQIAKVIRGLAPSSG